MFALLQSTSSLTVVMGPPALTERMNGQTATSAMGSKLYVRFLLSQGSAGDTLLVDDVDVWESADGKCKETR